MCTEHWAHETEFNWRKSSQCLSLVAMALNFILNKSNFLALEAHSHPISYYLHTLFMIIVRISLFSENEKTFLETYRSDVCRTDEKWKERRRRKKLAASKCIGIEMKKQIKIAQRKRKNRMNNSNGCDSFWQTMRYVYIESCCMTICNG